LIGLEICLKADRKLAKIYQLSQEIWEAMNIPDSKKKALRDAIKCGTGKLGAEEYSSGEEARYVPHTCGGPACADCGAKRAIEWILKQLCALPDIKWLGITMTMPYQLWLVFRDNQQLLAKVPALGAHAIDEWTRSHAGAVPFLITVMQTYNGELIFKPHLHIICSRGGMGTAKWNWIDNLGLESALRSIMELWRAKVLDYLAEAYREGLVRKSVSRRFLRDLEWQRTRDWHLWIEACSKYDLLNYDGRYVSRPPIAESNIKNVTEKGVQFIAKVYPGEKANPNGSHRDHRKIEKPVSLDLWNFIIRITNHLPERYRHNVRYFGLLAPRLKRKAQTVIEIELPNSVACEATNQAKQGSWPPKDFRGNPMRRIRSLSHQEFNLLKNS
jgi:hypothetical protein